jgi:uncharacterized protein with PQ loop repeat
MDNEDLKILPYTATSLSVVGRFIFMFLLYKNKSTNSLSLIFCILSIFSSSIWIYYSISIHDLPMIVRSSTELSLLSISSVYIIRNKLLEYQIDKLNNPNTNTNPNTNINTNINTNSNTLLPR